MRRAGLCAAGAALLAVACGRGVGGEAAALTGGDPGRGREVIRHYGCGSCHRVPGVYGASAVVAPSLERLAARVSIAGRLPNTAANLIRWVQHPQQIAPGALMPEMNVTEQDARDLAAYLYTLR
jgi:cytochrome c